MPQDFAPIVPRPLRPGDRIAVIAPSSPFDRTHVLRGLGWLGERYKVTFDPSLFERAGYLAGSDERRLGELDRFLRDTSVAAVVAVRGGYGLTRIAERADFAALRVAPKWLVGFSDVTALHVEALRAGVASLHAQNVGGLGQGDAHARAAFVSALESPLAERRHELTAVRPGLARGRLAGGNLSLLAACATAGRLRLPPGAILALEDVTEQAYRVDRLLTSLFGAGAFDGVGGIVLGDFTDCPPSAGVEAHAVLRERLGELRVPVASGLRFGHGAWNEPLTFGVTATLDATAGCLTVGAG
ncbi:MAG TPA: LD-carboxypeptidase [Polyangiaceae bacterium]|nr:LD-carboxypeptidase [Polyangiaceae bacterium]